MAEKKSVGIFYFSGTGNTEIVAALMAKGFENKGSTCEIYRIEDMMKGRIQLEIEKYDIIGMGHAVHALNAPKIFFDFIKRLPPGNKEIFLFKSSGDPFMRGGATTMIRDRLNQKGYHVFYEALIVMPSNVLVRYDDRLVKQLYETAVRKADKMVDDILAGKMNLQENDAVKRILTGLVSGLEWVGTPFFGKDLKVSQDCNLCDECVRNCPTGNICREGDRIKFGWKCMFCLRCVYRCPQKAVKPRLYRIFILKEYNIQKTIDDPSIKGDYLSEDTRGYFRHFYDYVKE